MSTGCRGQVVLVVRAVQAARAGVVRTALGNHVDVAARWLQQRGCHIDVVRYGGRRGAGGAGEVGGVPLPACGVLASGQAVFEILDPAEYERIRSRAAAAV